MTERRESTPQALYHMGFRTRLMALFAVDLFTQADQVIPTGELYCAKEPDCVKSRPESNFAV